MILPYGKWLKLIGFIMNIGASLYLINSVINGEGRPSFWDCLTGKKQWEELWGTRNYDLENLNKNVFITSAIVIIGSSLQFTGDLLDS
jgi:hypothetical protein